MIKTMWVRPIELKPGDHIPWFAGVVKDTEEARNGVWMVYLEHDPVPYAAPPYDPLEVHREMPDPVPSADPDVDRF